MRRQRSVYDKNESRTKSITLLSCLRTKESSGLSQVSQGIEIGLKSLKVSIYESSGSLINVYIVCCEIISKHIVILTISSKIFEVR